MSALKQTLKTRLKPAFQPALSWLEFQQLPPKARDAARRDHRGNLNPQDPGPQAVIDAGLEWLGLAQDHSTSADGGVARHWSTLNGWSPSYPETTGYIIPTLLQQADLKQDNALRQRAQRMLDWLVNIQFDNGGFQGGMIGQEPVVPVTFNTGQILLGLCAGARVWPSRYLRPMRKAADFLASSLDEDGCWRKYPTPFAVHDDKAYETHVSWALLDAAQVEHNQDWIAAAIRQVDWAATHQQENGWMAQCCLSDKTMPISHTLGYALRGFVEAWRYTSHRRFLLVAGVLAEGLRNQLEASGRLAGAFHSDWRPGVSWSCVTGAVQIAHCWLLLFQETGDEIWLDAGKRANGWARRTVFLDGDPETRGAVKGSYPCDGEYCRFEFPNWATKFMIDSCQLELDVCKA